MKAEVNSNNYNKFLKQKKCSQSNQLYIGRLYNNNNEIT